MRGAKYSIGIWGQFGGEGHVLADGQAVRTTIITNELKDKYGAENILVANTHNWKKRPLAFLCDSIRLILKSKVVLFLPADNGFKVFVPLILFINFFVRRHLIYIVIGGFLPNLLKMSPFYLRLVKKIDTLYVQTPNIKSDLENLGITRIKILSNLKRLNTVSQPNEQVLNSRTIKLCTLSRVIKEKGIEDAVSAINMVNQTLGEQLISLDIYGVVPPEYKPTFETILQNNSSMVSYKGIAQYDKTVEVLSGYFAMLFPTYYHGEGFPGNIVDAYNAGIPIIASDWMYNADVIQHNVNGILVQPKDAFVLRDAIMHLYNNRELAYQIAQNNILESKKYHPDAVLFDLYQEINNYINN